MNRLAGFSAFDTYRDPPRPITGPQVFPSSFNRTVRFVNEPFHQKSLHRQGCFIHPRYSLVPDYLPEKVFFCCRDATQWNSLHDRLIDGHLGGLWHWQKALIYLASKSFEKSPLIQITLARVLKFFLAVINTLWLNVLNWLQWLATAYQDIFRMRSLSCVNHRHAASTFKVPSLNTLRNFRRMKQQSCPDDQQRLHAFRSQKQLSNDLSPICFYSSERFCLPPYKPWTLRSDTGH